MDLSADMWADTVHLFVLLLPAMVANGSPVVGSKIYGRGTPIDGGRLLGDGKRILGDGKTYEGLVLGTVAGLVTGIIIGIISKKIKYYIYAGFLGGLGAMLGDMIGSFIKRRLGIKRGQPAPLLDQLDFYIGALTLLYIAGYTVHLKAALLLAVIVALLHISTNALAYILGIKDRPW